MSSSSSAFQISVLPSGRAFATQASEAILTAAIRSGVEPGDRVVVDGQLRLKDGARIRERGAQPGLVDPRTAKGS